MPSFHTNEFRLDDVDDPFGPEAIGEIVRLDRLVISLKFAKEH